MLNNPEVSFTKLAGFRDGEPELPLKRSVAVAEGIACWKQTGGVLPPHTFTVSYKIREVWVGCVELFTKIAQRKSL